MCADSTTPAKTFTISLDNGESFPCAEDEKILLAMEHAGVKGIHVGCRGGGCGACRVEVLDGDYETLRMGKNHVSDDEAQQGFALACRVFPKSDLNLKFAPKAPQTDKPANPQTRRMQLRPTLKKIRTRHQ